jgi:hypothetical protein
MVGAEGTWVAVTGRAEFENRDDGLRSAIRVLAALPLNLQDDAP